MLKASISDKSLLSSWFKFGSELKFSRTQLDYYLITSNLLNSFNDPSQMKSCFSPPGC